MRLRSIFGLSLLANRFPALHGLRVLGILFIIQIHLSFELATRGFLPQAGLLYRVSQKFWFGMDLFFVLSGFLIGTILIAADDELGGRRVLRFYARRSFRIIPLYYVVLTLLAALTPLDPLQRAQLPREYLYLTNYSDTAHVVMFWGWSLCVEEHFYLLVPFLVILLRKLRTHRARLVLLGVLFVSALGVRTFIVWLPHRQMDSAWYFHHVYIASHTRYDTLVAGIVAAYVNHHFGDAIHRFFAKPAMRVASLATMTVLFGAILVQPPFVAAAWNLLVLGTITGIAWTIAILYLLHVDGVGARLLGGPVQLRVATLGYGVYLVHFPLVLLVGIRAFLVFVIRSHVAVPLAFVLAVVMVWLFSLAIAWVFHLLVEKPALVARDRLVPGRG